MPGFQGAAAISLTHSAVFCIPSSLCVICKKKLEDVYNDVPFGATLTHTTCVVLACTFFGAPLTHTTPVILDTSSWAVAVLLQRLCLV
eukprot:892609-Ditylum_brightwellii.AAC.1